LSGAILIGTNLEKANLANANLTDVVIESTIWTGANLQGVIGISPK
jgi:uncharacterized protein YjbI with pentapeptide repeats